MEERGEVEEPGLVPESLLLQVSWRKGQEHGIGNCKALALSVGDPGQAMPGLSYRQRESRIPSSKSCVNSDGVSCEKVLINHQAPCRYEYSC